MLLYVLVVMIMQYKNAVVVMNLNALNVVIIISIIVTNVRHLYARHALKCHVDFANIFTATVVHQYVNANLAPVILTCVQSARQASSVMFAKRVYARNALVVVVMIVVVVMVMMVLQFVIMNIHGVVKHAAVIAQPSNFAVYVMNRNASNILLLVSNVTSKYAISLAHVLNVLMVNSVRNVSHIIVKNALTKT